MWKLDDLIEFSALNSVSSGPGSGTAGFVFLGKTLYFHKAPFHSSVLTRTAVNLILRRSPAIEKHPF